MTRRRSMAFFQHGNINLRFAVIGDAGAVEFQGDLRYTGMDNRGDFSFVFKPFGLEIHHRNAPEHALDSEPDFDDCWLIGGNCWHDGSSLMASEWAEQHIPYGAMHTVWDWLEARYTRDFGPEEHSHKEGEAA